MKEQIFLQGKRLQWVDYIKGLCMMAVILNHIHGLHLYGQLTYPFELVGFFFVAGYTFNHKDSFLAFFCGKCRTLLVPIVFLGLINSIVSYLMKGGSLLWRIEGLLVQRPGQWDDLWFVACLFTMEIMFYFIQKLTISLIVQCMICLALMFFGYLWIDNMKIMLPWHVENASILIVFLFLGYALRQSKLDVRLRSFILQGKGKIVLLAFLVWYIFLVLLVKNYPIDVHLHKYGFFAFFLLSAFLGLCVIVGLSWLMESYQHLSLRFLSYIGANTLVYYAFQSKAISLLELVSAEVGFELTSYVGSLVCCFFVCALLIIPSYVIKKYVPYMLGRSHTKK